MEELMGIRMHVAVGWGFDLTGRNLDHLDYEHLEDKNAFEIFKEDVISYAKEHNDLREKMTWHENMDPPSDFVDLVVYSPEFGLKDKLLFVPSGQRDTWARYGNLLDIFQYEAYRPLDNQQDSEWLEKPGTLYPYVGLMRANPDAPLGVEEYWDPFYLDREETRHAIPTAPRHLWFLIKHLRLNRPGESVTEAFLTLRPTFYRHFS